MTGKSDATGAPPQDGDPEGGETRYERNLRVAVMAMGLVLLLGLGVVIGRIVYLATRSTPSATLAGGATPVATASLPLPSGATVRSVSVSGNLLAVHFDHPSGPGIRVLDLATGQTLSRVTITPEPPRP